MSKSSSIPKHLILLLLEYEWLNPRPLLKNHAAKQLIIRAGFDASQPVLSIAFVRLH
jgi:hypothetical protein